MERKRVIRYGVSPSAFGYLLIATTERGICTVALGDDPAALVADLTRACGDAPIVQDGVLWA